MIWQNNESIKNLISGLRGNVRFVDQHRIKSTS